MTYRVLLEQAAQRDFRALDPRLAQRVRERLLSLEENPRPLGVRKLRDIHPPRYRLRAGDWRILYTVDDLKREVRIYRIKHRSQAY
jgi:mRNA interferase RelE/StbE